LAAQFGQTYWSLELGDDRLLSRPAFVKPFECDVTKQAVGSDVAVSDLRPIFRGSQLSDLVLAVGFFASGIFATVMGSSEYGLPRPGAWRR